MDATYKLHIKIGNAEFSAEGPQEVVQQQFEAFKALLERAPVTRTGQGLGSGKGTMGQEGTPEGGPDLGDLQNLFKVEDKNGRTLLTLRFLPQEDRAPDSMLLLLLGYKRLGMDEVPVTVLKECMDRSGASVSRVDRTAFAPLERANLAKRSGKGKASQYWLTNPGITRAEEIAGKMLEQL